MPDSNCPEPEKKKKDKIPESFQEFLETFNSSSLCVDGFNQLIDELIIGLMCTSAVLCCRLEVNGGSGRVSVGVSCCSI